MSGIEDNNFPAFDMFTKEIEANTEFSVISPADLDRDLGFDGTETVTGDDLRKVLTEDIDHIMHECHAIALMPGWRNSSGARVELHVAAALGLELYELEINYWSGLKMIAFDINDVPGHIPQRV